MLSTAELGVFEANNDETTRCKQCVLNCFEYLRSKEKIKQDTKILRNLMKAETQYEKNLSTKSNEEILRETDEHSSPNALNNKNDIILIENDDSPGNCLNDEQQTNQENKENFMQKTFYWIGKETLKLWPNLALKKYELQLPTSKSNDLDEEVEEVSELPDVKLNEASMLPEESKKSLSVATAEPQEVSVELTYFNEDIICPHKNLSTTVNKRLITSNTWKLFEHYFYSDSLDFQPKIFTNESRTCKICQKSNEETANKTLEIKN